MLTQFVVPNRHLLNKSFLINSFELTKFQLTFHQWHNLNCFHRPFGRKLTKNHFQKVKRFSNEEEDDQVWNKKCSSSVFVSNVWKPVRRKSLLNVLQCTDLRSFTSKCFQDQPIKRCSSLKTRCLFPMLVFASLQLLPHRSFLSFLCRFFQTLLLGQVKDNSLKEQLS